jgi:phosphate transport system substrate-binding protein
VQNASGNWVQPYAVNISAALQSAQLAADTSQNLTAVYTSSNPAAYPISAYSYILVQCAPNSARSTCLSPYTNPGIANTLSQFMSFVACAGQIHMAAIGYAPLPPQLSQFLADAVGYMTNQPAQQLNASNCSNPTFSGSLGADASPPPLPPIGNAPGGSAASSSGARAGAQALGPGGVACSPTTTTTTTTTTTKPVGGTKSTTTTTKAASGSAPSTTTTTTTSPCSSATAGSTGGTGSGPSIVHVVANSKIKPAAPAALAGGQLPTSPLLPLLALLLLLAVPVVILSVNHRKRETESVEPHDSIVP